MPLHEASKLCMLPVIRKLSKWNHHAGRHKKLYITEVNLAADELCKNSVFQVLIFLFPVPAFDCSACVIHVDNKMKRPVPVDFEKYIPFFLQDNPDESCAKAGHAAYGQVCMYCEVQCLKISPELFSDSGWCSSLQLVPPRFGIMGQTELLQQQW